MLTELHIENIAVIEKADVEFGRGLNVMTGETGAGKSIIIGALAGIIVVYSCLFIERVLKIDDPVGAISVHGVCGSFGTLCVGLFGQRAVDLPFWADNTAIRDGLFFGGGFGQVGVQLLGIAVVFVYAFGMAMIVFTILKATIGLRVSDAEQLEGLDLGEHGNIAYGGFVFEATGPSAITYPTESMKA